MSPLLSVLAQVPGVRLVGELTDQVVQRVHADTRSLQPGDFFVALRGERFDANDYLLQARASGAVCALTERGLEAAGLPGVVVPDSRVALGQWAALWRKERHLPVIAVTGSNGKTTVTQMIASILRAAVGDDALATRGNLNNDIGVPLTLLRLQAHHRLAVVELGMNHPGEIAGLAAMAAPTVALVNNAQREHQEFMATVEAVARENACCFNALPANGVAVFPADDAYTSLWRTLSGGRRRVLFGAGPDADVRGQAQWNSAEQAWQLKVQTPVGGFDVLLHVAGRHNVRNALAATACAWAAGVSLSHIADGLTQFVPVNGRSRAMALHLNGHHVNLVDDSYNANPDSVRAAIDVLAELPGPRLLALGDMGEVGDQGLAFHQEVLTHAVECGIEHIWVTGDWMRECLDSPAAEGWGTAVRGFDSVEALVSAAVVQAQGLASVLVKGSRFMRMERVVQALMEQQKQGGHHVA